MRAFAAVLLAGATLLLVSIPFACRQTPGG